MLESIKNTTEAMKVTSEVIKIFAEKSLDGFGTVLSKVCMPAAEEYGLYLRDKVSGWRQQNAQKVLQQSIDLIGENRPDKKLPEQKFSLLMPILEYIPNEDDPILQDLWAKLLATSFTEGLDRKIYSRILMQLDRDDAITFQKIIDDISKQNKDWENVQPQRYEEYKERYKFVTMNSDIVEEELKESFLQEESKPVIVQYVHSSHYDPISILNLKSHGLVEHPSQKYSKEIRTELYDLPDQIDQIEIDTIDRTALTLTDLGWKFHQIVSFQKS